MTIGQMPDAPTQHFGAAPTIQAVPMNAPAPSKAASELAQMIQEAQANLALVLERVSVATKRGLDDSAGASSGGGEPVGGTKDHTQQMLDKLGGGGTRKDGTNVPLERDDEARRHLALLVASVEAAHAWSSKAKAETFRLTPLSQEKAKLLLGDGPSKCLNPNCGRDVWRTPNDRLRAGRCDACYRYWDRHDRTEERPHALCHPEEVQKALQTKGD